MARALEILADEVKEWTIRRQGECLAAEPPMNCPACGFANAATARFCGGCGNRLEAAAPEAERRQICVLFCDLVGSTPLSQSLDPEDLRSVLGAYRHACEAVVLRHGGFVAQYYGDGVEVYFGYPNAREDDASRVVRCALDMLEAIRQLAKATRLDLKVRIAIDSGRVVVGSLGSSGHTAIGDTPNIAARAQAEAAPGEVVVTNSLRRLLAELDRRGVDGLAQAQGRRAAGGALQDCWIERPDGAGRHQPDSVRRARQSARAGP